MNTWIDRFARMSPEERAMTVAEDPSTFTALVNEAAVMQDWYRRWRLARDADPPTQPDDLSGPAGGALVGQTEPTESTGPYLCACTCGCVDMTIRRGRCMVCRVRESCRDLMTCEACAAGYRLASDGIHYDHNDSTWGVCRKVIASIRMDRERQRSENP